MNPKLIKKHFEKSLDTYNQNAVVQNIMANLLLEEISKISTNFDNILELGSGAGLLTQKITNNLKFESYSANDLCEKSKCFISRIIPTATFYKGNALKIKPSKKMDLIISNAMFQWFERLDKASVYFKNLLKKDGILAFSTFSPENFKEIKEITGLSLNYKSSQEIKEIFEKDYKILCTKEFSHILNFSNPLELLAHMKNTGVNSLDSKHWTIKDVKEFCDKYKEKFPKISITYSPIIVICKKL